VASNLVRLWSFSAAIQIQGGCIYYLESAPAQSPETIPNTHTSNPFPTQIFFASSIPPLTPVLLICPSKDSLAHTRKQPTKPLIPRHIASMLWEDLTATAQTDATSPTSPPPPTWGSLPSVSSYMYTGTRTTKNMFPVTLQKPFLFQDVVISIQDWKHS